MHRASQRSYTPINLEIWFERINQDWESWFSEDELTWGRQYYRTNQARATELLDDSAVIHFGTRKEELYIIVDWDEQRPSFRISNPSLCPGNALGVAGLYELEEFLADEIPPVSDEVDVQKNKQPPDLRRNVSVSRNLFRSRVKAEKKIEVSLGATAKGIRLSYEWLDLKNNPLGRIRMRDLNSAEREEFIKYTTLVHRAGFNYNENSTQSYLSDPNAIQLFLNQGIHRWRRQLRLKIDRKLESWKKGVEEVSPRLKIAERGEHEANYQWQFGLNGHWLGEAERKMLIRQTGQVHLIPGRGMVRLGEKAQDVLNEWKSWSQVDAEGSLPRYLLFSFLGDSVIDIDMSHAIEKWRKQLFANLVKGKSMPQELRPYQKVGVNWMRNLLASGCHALLADEMGLGKTIQTLTVLSQTGAMKKEAVLIVCPSSVVPVWKSEIQTRYPRANFRILSRYEPFDSKAQCIWISSYSQLRRNKQAVVQRHFHTVVLDEAQTIKNPDAKTTQACFALNSNQRIVLTGTPLENRPMDIWTLFRFLMPGLLGSKSRFEKRSREEGSDFSGRLRVQLEPFILRRTKSAVLKELPEKSVFNWQCQMTPQQQALYREISEGGLKELGDDLKDNLSEKPIHLFALLTKLRQACCDPYLVSKKDADWRQSGKLLSLVDRLNEAISNGSKVVIFSQFVEFLKRARLAIRSSFPELKIFELTGKTVDRAKPVEQFQQLDDPAVFLISLKAGGTGLNLQSADYVFLLDPWWNPAVEAQAIDRVHRFGQKNSVFVYRFLTTNTIEERIEVLKQGKQTLFDELLSNMDRPVDLFDHFNSLRELISYDSKPNEPVQALDKLDRNGLK